MTSWSMKSSLRLSTCHPLLQEVANKVLELHDCSVFEGYRNEETQNKYYDKGTSQVRYPFSKHNNNPSMAIDLAPYKPTEDPYDKENVLFFAGLVLAVADYTLPSTHKLRWGGNWSTTIGDPFSFDTGGFYDGIHFELIEL